MKNPRLAIPINMGLCTLSFAITLPATLAMFPQISEVNQTFIQTIQIFRNGVLF